MLCLSLCPQLLLTCPHTSFSEVINVERTRRGLGAEQGFSKSMFGEWIDNWVCKFKGRSSSYEWVILWLFISHLNPAWLIHVEYGFYMKTVTFFLKSSQSERRPFFLDNPCSNYSPGSSCSMSLGEQKPWGWEKNGSLGRKADAQEWGFGDSGLGGERFWWRFVSLLGLP